MSGTVELVTDSTFEVAQVSIQGFPKQIPDDNPNRFPSLVVPGPFLPGKSGVKQPSLCTFRIRHFNLFVSDVHTFMSLMPFIKGFAFDATIERAFVRVPSRLFGDRIFGKAQVTRKICELTSRRNPN